MDYFAGLDVSLKETSICIVDDAGKIVREVRRQCPLMTQSRHRLAFYVCSLLGRWRVAR